MNWLYEFIGSMLSWFSSLFGGSYALGLLIYALLFKILFLPFLSSVAEGRNPSKQNLLVGRPDKVRAVMQAAGPGRDVTVMPAL